MEFQVILMRRAIRDLNEIGRRISQDDPDLAERFRNKLIDRTVSLSNFPEMGRVVPEFYDSSIREIIYDSYRIVYRVRRVIGKIHIIRFWHAARGTPKI